MGGRGSASAAGRSAGATKRDINLSESIKQEMLDYGLNSRISGIRQKAEQGIGNYAFRNADAISAETIYKVGDVKFHERNGNTLVEGYLENGRHVYYANKSDSPEIQKLMAVQTEKKEKIAEIVSHRVDFDSTGKTTTTYDRARKNRMRKFDAYFNDSSGKK